MKTHNPDETNQTDLAQRLIAALPASVECSILDVLDNLASSGIVLVPGEDRSSDELVEEMVEMGECSGEPGWTTNRLHKALAKARLELARPTEAWPHAARQAYQFQIDDEIAKRQAR